MRWPWIGYIFRDRALLVTALTHISAVASERRSKSYQRLEFLGDAVLGIVVPAHGIARVA